MSLQKIDICASKNKRLALLFLIFAISLALRLFTITERDLSHDEAYTLYGLNSFENAIDIAKNDNHPPLYFMLFNIIFQGFGESTNIKRAMHAFQGAINSTLIGATAGLLSNDRALIMAGLLSAFCPAQIGPSQRIDHYVWFELLSTLTLLFYILYTKHSKHLICLTIISTTLFFSHHFGFFLIIGVYLPLLFEKRNKKFFLSILFLATTILLWMIYLAFYNPVFGLLIGKTDSIVSNAIIFPHHNTFFFTNIVSVITKIFIEPFSFDFSIFYHYNNYIIAFFSTVIILIHWKHCKITAYPIIISIISFIIFSFIILEKTSINHFTTIHLAFIRPAMICTLSYPLSRDKTLLPCFYGLLFWFIFSLFPYYGTGFQGSYFKNVSWFNLYISANITEKDCFFYSDDMWIKRNIGSMRLPDNLKNEKFIPFPYPENINISNYKHNNDSLIITATEILKELLKDKDKIFVLYDYPRKIFQWGKMENSDKKQLFTKGDEIKKKDLFADQFLEIFKNWDIKVDIWDIGGGLLMANIPDKIKKSAQKAKIEENLSNLKIIINKKFLSATPKLYWNYIITHPRKIKKISFFESQYQFTIPRDEFILSSDNCWTIMNQITFGEPIIISRGIINCDQFTNLPIITVDSTIFHNPLWRLFTNLCAMIITANIIVYLIFNHFRATPKQSGHNSHYDR